MCGFAGFAGRGDSEDLRRMTAALQHRGPDDEGAWQENGLHLGFRRLSIIDLAGGHQPMWTADGATGVVFNGEIYNHRELRAQLESAGHAFQSDHCDTEVLLHGYREWGENFTERLNGMWAFVIYDRARRRLFGSRDRFGKKPFYYFRDNENFVFASELKSLIQHSAVPRDISALSLKKYFAYCYVPAPRSIYERVWKLPGGHSFTFALNNRDFRLWRYWQFLIEPREKNEQVWCEEIRDLLDQAVQRRLMADVPLGVFLSGGIDSSAVAAFAARHVGGKNLNTFSIGFDEASFDESGHARRTAEQLKTRHRFEILSLEKSRKLLPDISARLDEPIGDSSLLPTFLLSRFTRQHITVALGGDGGDELFAGYDPFRALRRAQLYDKTVPRPLHLAIRLIAARLPVSHRNISLDFKIKRTLAGLSYPQKLWNPIWMGAVEPHDLARLFNEPIDIEEIYSEAIEAWDNCQQNNLPDRTLQFFTNLYLQDDILAKVDRSSMMNSLEARSPFLDIDFVNLARTIPHQLKLRGTQTKYILKKALEPVLPRETIYRAKKGFGTPVGRWIKEGKLEFHLERCSTMLNSDFVRERLLAHRSGQSDERLFLWSYWLFTEWMATS